MTTTRSTWIDLLIFTAIVLLYCLPFLYNDLYYNDGVRYGGLVRDMIARDAWFTLSIGGEPYLDKPPIYFIVLRAAAELAGTAEARILLIANAATLLIYAAASYSAARMLGSDIRTARIATLMLLSLPICGWFANGLRMDFLFAAAIIASFAFLVRGLETAHPNWRTLMGGALAGIAVLIKGPFGVMFPVAGVAAYLLITRQGWRLTRRDAWGALALCAALVALWLVALLVTFGRPALENIIQVQVIERATSSVDGRKPWSLYLTNGPAILLPWLVLLIPALALRPIRARLFALNRPALAWVCFFAVSMLIMQIVAQKSTKYLFPVLPVATLWLATAFVALEATRPHLVSIMIAAMAIIGAILFAALAVANANDPSLIGDLAQVLAPQTVTLFLGLAAGACLVALIGCILKDWHRILPMALATALILTAAKALIVPGALTLYSPRAVAEVIDTTLPEGAPVLAYDIYRGALSFHLDRPIHHVSTPEALRARLAQTGPVALVTWRNRLPEGLDASTWTLQETVPLAGRNMNVWTRD